MKNIIKTLIMVLLISALTINLHAEEEAADMSRFSFKIILEHCDQNDPTKIIRFKDEESGDTLFCLEPETDYSPRLNRYYRKDNTDKRLYDLYKAFIMSDQSNEYFVGVQLLMWEYRTGIRYSFAGKDASDYHEAEIEEMIASFSEYEKEDYYLNDLELSKPYQINIADLDKYRIETDIEITEKTKESLSFRINEQSEEDMQIKLYPLDDYDGSIIYHSDDSQDILVFEGDYPNRKIITYHLKLKEEEKRGDEEFAVFYTKKDENGSDIEGARFTLYQLNESADQEIYFISRNKDVDLLELVGISEDKDEYKIEVSERFDSYLDDYHLDAKECGYFPLKITKNGQIIIDTLVYVMDDESIKGLKKVNIEQNVYSDGNGINHINKLKRSEDYILCESEPAKGYTYANNPCVLIKSEDYNDETFPFVNLHREYSLRLYKENADHDLLLNGAKFSLTYKENGEDKEMIFVTGALNIARKEGKNYLIYTYEDSEDIKVEKFDGDYFIKENIRPGIYHYYQSEDNLVDKEKLQKHQIRVINGGYELEDLPYDTLIHLKELEAPRGYFIDEADFELRADIPYSEIVFRNYRINEFIIVPDNHHRIPKTCIGG